MATSDQIRSVKDSARRLKAQIDTDQRKLKDLEDTMKRDMKALEDERRVLEDQKNKLQNIEQL